MPVNAVEPKIHLHRGDLPQGLDFGSAVAVDTETTGLSFVRDRLCMVQLSAGDGVCHLVRFPKGGGFEAPNLRAVLEDPETVKIFHFARFDLVMLRRWLGVDCQSVYCTRTASKLVRTYTGDHGLKHVIRELLGIEISKQQQSSDWGADELSDNQLRYAATDVLYLHEIRRKLDVMLAREGRSRLAAKCFDFLRTRAELDLAGWADNDIFAH